VVSRAPHVVAPPPVLSLRLKNPTPICFHANHQTVAVGFEAQLEDQKGKKTLTMSSRRRKNHKTNKSHKKQQVKQNSKEEFKIKNSS
jgi:hypothetical protein